MIAIVDYGMGNLHSVAKALERVTHEEVVVSSDSEALDRASRIVLPGVGAFGQGMINLISMGLVPVLERNILEKKKPFLGICLGMQLLAETSTEKGQHKGLGWVKGAVIRFDGAGIKVPHVGWNNIEPTKGLMKECYLGDGSFYFVHSYHFVAKEHIAATCDYGKGFVAAVEKGNIFATQFHPEKSQKNGQRLLKKWVEWKC
jgi:glutamine amidotransferase